VAGVAHQGAAAVRSAAPAEDLGSWAMKDELLDYEIRISEDANERYGAFKVGAHDDLVTALGLAVQDRRPEPLRLIC
jgi:hypothetical protein